MRFRPYRSLLAATAILTFLVPHASAQSTEPELKARLIQKPLYLRGLWKQDTLKFDSAGNSGTPTGSESFTLCGIDVRDVQFEGDHLLITGDRMGLEFAPKMPRVSVHRKIQIEIAGTSATDFGPALDRIFADSLADLTASMPSFWQPFAHKNFLHEVDTIQPSSRGDSRKTGDRTTYPELIFSAGIDYSEAAAAEKLKYRGIATVSVVVTKDGMVASPRIVTPLGLGLDELAIEAVSRYRFKPATVNKEPVATEVNIEIPFNPF